MKDCVGKLKELQELKNTVPQCYGTGWLVCVNVWRKTSIVEMTQRESVHAHALCDPNKQAHTVTITHPEGVCSAP